MSKTLLAMLLPFLSIKFNFGDGDGGAIEVPQETPATEQIVEPATVDETKAEGTQPEDKPAEKTFTQAELDEIVQKRIAKLERKAEKQRIEAETRAKVMQEVREAAKPISTKPSPEDFTDYSEYQEALTDWKVDEKLKSIELQKEQEKVRASQQSEAERIREREAHLIEAGERKYDDFEDVVRSNTQDYSKAAYLSILESDISAEIMYHLAKNQDEAKRIAGMPAFAQAKEIGKLEDKLSAKQPIKPSNAPSPISPIEGKGNLTKKLEDMTYEEMLEHDRKRGAKYLNR